MYVLEMVRKAPHRLCLHSQSLLHKLVLTFVDSLHASWSKLGVLPETLDSGSLQGLLCCPSRLCTTFLALWQPDNWYRSISLKSKSTTCSTRQSSHFHPEVTLTLLWIPQHHRDREKLLPDPDWVPAVPWVFIQSPWVSLGPPRQCNAMFAMICFGIRVFQMNEEQIQVSQTL